jgi:hypothetical protein
MSLLSELFYLYLTITTSMHIEGIYIDPADRFIYAYYIRKASLIYGLEDPVIAVAIIGHESKWNPLAIRPGCTKRIKKKCNKNGRPDVGLFQLHMNPSWSRITKEQALDFRINIFEGIRQLLEKKEHHRLRVCERQKEWKKKWGERIEYENHTWIQHNNMGSKYYEKKIRAKIRSIKRRFVS